MLSLKKAPQEYRAPEYLDAEKIHQQFLALHAQIDPEGYCSSDSLTIKSNTRDRISAVLYPYVPWAKLLKGMGEQAHANWPINNGRIDVRLQYQRVYKKDGVFRLSPTDFPLGKDALNIELTDGSYNSSRPLYPSPNLMYAPLPVVAEASLAASQRRDDQIKRRLEHLTSSIRVSFKLPEDYDKSIWAFELFDIDYGDIARTALVLRPEYQAAFKASMYYTTYFVKLQGYINQGALTVGQLEEYPELFKLYQTALEWQQTTHPDKDLINDGLAPAKFTRIN